jgi:hypothetical protein
MMTKAEIRAELRRSAMEDERPMGEMSEEAWMVVLFWRRYMYEVVADLSIPDLRTFMLLVAEAL